MPERPTELRVVTDDGVELAGEDSDPARPGTPHRHPGCEIGGPGPGQHGIRLVRGHHQLQWERHVK